MSTMRFRSRRWPLAPALLCGALLVAAGTASGAPAKAPIDVINFRVGFTSNTENNVFKIGSWTPVWIQLSAGDERFSGYLELTVPDDDGTPTVVHQPVELGAKEDMRVIAYTRPGSVDPEFGIRLYDPSRRYRSRLFDGKAMTQGSSAGSGISALRADQTLLLTLGKPQGVDMIP